MLHKSVSYNVLLRILGLLTIVYGLYNAWFPASVFLGGGDNLSGTLIEILGPLGGVFPRGGVLIYIALGLFFLGISSMRVPLAYWSLQLAVWLIGINLWYSQNGETNVQLVPPFATPLTFWPQMAITLGCSLLLFALYIPLTRLLSWLFETGRAKPNAPAPT